MAPLVGYFVLVFTITWGVGAVCLFAPKVAKSIAPGPALTNPLFYVAVYAPTIAALILTAYFGGGIGLRKLLARLIPWRAGLRWYLAILVGFPLVGLLAAGWRGCLAPLRVMFPTGRTLLRIDPGTGDRSGPLGEELGWRGFALPECWSAGHHLPQV